MRRAGGPPSRVGSVLRDVLERVDPEHEMRAYSIWTFWNDEVGDMIARRAQPAQFRNGILFISVATQSWMQELQFMKNTIRDRLNRRLGGDLVRDIYLVPGRLGPPAGVPAPRAAGRLPAGHRLVPLPPMADPELAAAFRRVVDARARRLAGHARGSARHR
ncbi:MAG: DUF721 domain-containing protein [Candidatus Binatia bacterium]